MSRYGSSSNSGLWAILKLLFLVGFIIWEAVYWMGSEDRCKAEARRLDVSYAQTYSFSPMSYQTFCNVKDKDGKVSVIIAP